MKKILIINTKYREYGGEDSNIIEEQKFLSEKYEVQYLEYDNSDTTTINDVFSLFLANNRKSNAILSEKLKDFDPDLVYVHNTWFKANLGVFSTIKSFNIPIILKIHNFRYACSNTYLMSKHLNGEKFCFKCGLANSNKIFNKYFDKSYLKSYFLIRYGKKYINLLKKLEIKILVMTEFQKEYMKNLGVSSKKIYIYPNPISSKQLPNSSYNSNSDYVVYAGRISEPKGLENLIKAWNTSENENMKLKIIGDGDLLKSLQQNVKNINIEFLGKKSNSESLDLIKNARAVVTATKMFEGQPRLLCEASFMEVPSIFPDFGGMAEFFPENYMLKFEQYNYVDLTKKLNLLQQTDLLKNISVDVKKYLEDKISETIVHKKFKEIVHE